MLTGAQATEAESVIASAAEYLYHLYDIVYLLQLVVLNNAKRANLEIKQSEPLADRNSISDSLWKLPNVKALEPNLKRCLGSRLAKTMNQLNANDIHLISMYRSLSWRRIKGVERSVPWRRVKIVFGRKRSITVYNSLT